PAARPTRPTRLPYTTLFRSNTTRRMHPSPCAEGRTCCCCPSPRRYRSDPDLPGRFAGRGCPRGKSRNCPKFPEFPGEEVRPRASRRFRRNRRGFSPPTRPLAPSDEKRLRPSENGRCCPDRRTIRISCAGTPSPLVFTFTMIAQRKGRGLAKVAKRTKRPFSGY